MKPIERYSIGYQLLRSWVRFSLLKLFYRKVEIRGLDKIDPEKPSIFAPNHQNALLDALLLVTTLKQQPVFLARADIFEKKKFISILRFFKMLPVYRMRDGFDTLKKNEEIFDQCVDLLSNNGTLILFPEGNHAELKHFRPLKKGLARIAFEAEKRNDFKLGLQVIPVGIDYYDYRKFRSKVTVIFGDPIDITSLKKNYEENQQKGLRQLNLALTEEIEPHMIEIPWKEKYDCIMNIKKIYGERFHKLKGNGKRGLIEKFDSNKKLINILGRKLDDLPEKYAELKLETDSYLEKVEKLKLRDHIFRNAPYSNIFLIFNTLLIILLLPIYLYGAINNYVIFKLPDWYTKNKLRNNIFRSSIAYVMAFLLLLPLLYTIQTIIIASLTPGWWIPVLYLITLIPAGLFAIHYSFWYKKLLARWRFSIMRKRNNQDILNLIKSRNWIIGTLDEITA